jgi:hypothetical protein
MPLEKMLGIAGLIFLIAVCLLLAFALTVGDNTSSTQKGQSYERTTNTHDKHTP